MRNIAKRLVQDEAGATAIEYALTAGIMAAIAVAGIGLLGPGLTGSLSNVADQLNRIWDR